MELLPPNSSPISLKAWKGFFFLDAIFLLTMLQRVAKKLNITPGGQRSTKQFSFLVIKTAFSYVAIDLALNKLLLLMARRVNQETQCQLC